jgi:beta-lactamase class A
MYRVYSLLYSACSLQDMHIDQNLMKRSVSRVITLLVMAIWLLTGCTAQSRGVSEVSSTPLVEELTVTTLLKPSATLTPQIAENVWVAGIDLSALNEQDARSQLEQNLAVLMSPLELRAGSQTLQLDPNDLGLKIAYDDMLAEAFAAPSGTRIGLQSSYDEGRLQRALQNFAAEVDQAPLYDLVVASNPISRSFVVEPGLRLDTDSAARLIGTRLRSVDQNRWLELALQPDLNTGKPTPKELQAQLEAAAEHWKGIVGISVYDLQQAKTIAEINPNTVFSGASVMKAVIMLNAYIHVEEFSERQLSWLEKMIVESDNWSANQMLAASVGGTDVMAALEGAKLMTSMLEELGLEHTYQYSPYQSQDFLLKRNVPVQTGPAREGEAPYTEADRRLRTTPAEMSKIFVLIEACSHGEGLLLELYDEMLTSERCQEMIELLRRNADNGRMVAGFPKGTQVAHKSGWIDDMQADVGIVNTPGGDFVLAVYVYQTRNFANSADPTPALGQLANIVYTYYNPVVIDEDVFADASDETEEPRETALAPSSQTTSAASPRPSATPTVAESELEADTTPTIAESEPEQTAISEASVTPTEEQSSEASVTPTEEQSSEASATPTDEPTAPPTPEPSDEPSPTLEPQPHGPPLPPTAQPSEETADPSP